MPEIHAETTPVEAVDQSNEQKSLGQLVADASRDLSSLVRSEIALAKAEVMADVKRGGIGAGLAAAAGFMAYMMLMIGSIAVALAIWGAGIPIAGAFGIVAGAYLVLAAILGLVGLLAFRKLNKARRTKQTFRADLALMKRNHQDKQPTQIERAAAQRTEGQPQVWTPTS